MHQQASYLPCAVRILLKLLHDTDRNAYCLQDGVTGLITASLRGHEKVVEVLIKAGANLDHKRKVLQNLCRDIGSILLLSANLLMLCPDWSHSTGLCFCEWSHKGCSTTYLSWSQSGYP